MIDFSQLITQEQVAKENKDLLIELMKLSISDLAGLEKINNEKIVDITSEINFKVLDDSMDEIDKIEIKKFFGKANKLNMLIKEANDRKYNEYLKNII
ncbi:hypothetical protein HNQ02_003043 [Flavobacterium sp. 7E]|uniref:hypothetical protein n=1 Tax=Flavobacterium sp. 7E TaxID=2735898 RepID=UPI00156DE3B6|nr:hypothetical protein [Flavobacterium sp. 7E]NRS90106.1 hypothetical protein [Flavobacterium sp. 7E]